MKKGWIVLCTLLAACSLVQPKEEVRFKNPIFYQRMPVGGGQPHDEFVTPNSITTVYNDENGKVKLLYPAKQTYPCELLENEETYIVLRCCYQKTCDYSRYTSIQWDEDSFSNEQECLIMLEETEKLPFPQKVPKVWAVDKKDLPSHNCGPVKKLNYKRTMFPYRYSQEP